MYDELTAVDIKKMQEEIDHRTGPLRKELIANLQFARSYGDLSENFEYKEAKRLHRQNESRIRYLKRMIKTAHVVSAENAGDGVGLFDHVTLYLPKLDKTMTVWVVTPLRVDSTAGRVSRESPLGAAIFGHQVGETLTVTVNDKVSYPVVIQAIQKGEDDESLKISGY